MTQLFSANVNDIMSSPASLNTTSVPDFRIVYQLYAEKVFRKCMGMLKEEALAMDTTQDVFVKVFQNLSAFRRESKIASWIYSITHNCCIDRIRRRKKQIISTELHRDLPAPNEKPYYQILEQKIIQLEKILTALPDDYEQILMMKYWEGMSLKEIACKLNKSESAVKMKMKRAREKARKYRKEMVLEVI